jgi:hypothetical protein
MRPGIVQIVAIGIDPFILDQSRKVRITDPENFEFKEEGLFPSFPFGTDFTEEELVLGRALRGLKERMAETSPGEPSSLEAAMAISSVPEAAKPYLERMQLDAPATEQETMMQKLVIYALTSAGVA